MLQGSHIIWMSCKMCCCCVADVRWSVEEEEEEEEEEKRKDQADTATFTPFSTKGR